MGGGTAASRINGRPAVRQPRIHKQAVNNLRVRQTEASIKSDLSDALQPAEAASPRQRDAQSSVNTPLVGRRRGGSQLEGRCQSVGGTDRQTDRRKEREGGRLPLWEGAGSGSAHSSPESPLHVDAICLVVAHTSTDSFPVSHNPPGQRDGWSSQRWSPPFTPPPLLPTQSICGLDKVNNMAPRAGRKHPAPEDRK